MKKPTEKIHKLSEYYYRDIQKLLYWLIPPWGNIIEFELQSNNLLSLLPNRSKMTVNVDDPSGKQVKKIQGIFDYIILTNVFSFLYDVQSFVKNLKNITHDQSRVVIISFSFFWKPLLDIAAFLNLRIPSQFESNWLSSYDIQNLFYLENFELVKKYKRTLLPIDIPVLSYFVNTFLANLPGFQSLCLTEIFIFRRLPKPQQYSASIIIPARNEEGNIPGLLNRIPKMTQNIEIIFVEGHSKDNTYQAIQKEISCYKGSIKPYLYKQKGIGKRDAVELGLKKAKNDLIIILDADLTVDPSELPKFYNAIYEGKGDLVIGSRLVYPMERQAMRTLNIMGNKFFSMAFTFLIGQTIKDTLCGTKAFLLSTYKKIERNRAQFGNFDPYGDFDLIFGASKLNLKITEIPVRYKERTYGTSNITRFSHGLLLLRMTFIAARKLKFV